MKGYVQEGDILTLTAPYAVTAGGGVLVGSIFGIATVDAASGAEVQVAVEGVYDIVAEGAGSGQALAVGAVVYWDNSAKRVTATATSNTKIGVATAAKVTTATSARVRLNAVFG